MKIKNIRWLMEELEIDYLLVFDLETTGLSHVFDDVIEFAGCLISKNDYNFQYSVIKPKTPIYKINIPSISSLSIDDITEKGIDIEEMLDRLNGLIDMKDDTRLWVCAHNARFDLRFMYSIFRKRGIPLDRYPFMSFINVIDTMQMSHNIISVRKLDLVIKSLSIGKRLSDFVHIADEDVKLTVRALDKLIHICKKQDEEKVFDLIYENRDRYITNPIAT